MSEEDKEHRNYVNVMSHEEKPFGRHVRHNNNTRFVTHPYSQQNSIMQNLDANVPNDLNQMQLDHTRQMQNFGTIGHQNLLQNQTIAAQNIDSRVKSNSNATRSGGEKNHATVKSAAVDSNVENIDAENVSNTQESKVPDVIRLPENLENLPKADEFPLKRSRWNTNEEILALLLNFSKHEEWQSKDVVIRPESGSMLMYSRKKVRYRRDGYCWKKRKDGKTTREDHMKLKVQGVECIYGCYVHSAVLPTFHRRCYWLLQNPDIVLVHYLNVPYPDDSKLAALIPNIAFWTEKKEWTREELLLQLKPMYENPNLENCKETDREELKMNRVDQVSSFIESMIAQLLEKQRYVRTALANSLECGCGSRKCMGATRCTRPIRRISSAKKQGKRSNMNTKLQEKRAINNTERNVLKTTAYRKLSGLKIENRSCTQSTSSTFYSSQTHHNESEQSQLQQLLTQPQQTQNEHLMQAVNSKEILTNYSRTDMRVEGYLPNVEFVSGENQHYQSNYSCQLVDQYVPNNEMIDEKQEITSQENISTSSNLNLIQYQNDDNEYVADKYQSDTTDGSECNSYSTIHHQASPDESFTSVDETEVYPNGDVLDDLIMNVNQCYNYENGDYNADRSLYELIIQLTQKEKKSTTANSLLSYEKLQQYGLHSESADTCEPIYESNTQSISDANGNFLNSYSKYSTTTEVENVNMSNVLSTEFTRIEDAHMENYPAEMDTNFINTSGFAASERSTTNQSEHQDSRQHDAPCIISDLAPEWSYCEGGTKLLIIGPWYFQSDYSVLFDSYSVPATLIQTGVLRCYCPEHAVGLVSIQVLSNGSIISNSVVFEYKKRTNYEENVCHNLCNIKSEHYNQYMYENDTLLKFILIQRIEAIQDDAFMHSSSLINKYEGVREKTTM